MKMSTFDVTGRSDRCQSRWVLQSSADVAGVADIADDTITLMLLMLLMLLADVAELSHSKHRIVRRSPL